MFPKYRRIFVIALVIAFAVFLALGFYIQLKGLVYDDASTAPPVYQAAVYAGRGAAHAQV